MNNDDNTTLIKVIKILLLLILNCFAFLNEIFREGVFCLKELSKGKKTEIVGRGRGREEEEQKVTRFIFFFFIINK